MKNFMILIQSYTNYHRYRINKRRALKTGTFENCWETQKGLIKLWVLMEVRN